jgi:hypothetical protein
LAAASLRNGNQEVLMTNLFAFLEVIDKIENKKENDDLRLSRG